MDDLTEMFSNRAEVAQSLSDAQEMVIQTNDGNGKELTLEEQIVFAQSSD